MARTICYYRGFFFEWSSVIDAPVTMAMAYPQFHDYYLVTYGIYSINDIEARCDRAIAYGTSSFDIETLEEFTKFNRAGPNETCATIPEILRIVGIPESLIEEENEKT